MAEVPDYVPLMNVETPPSAAGGFQQTYTDVPETQFMSKPGRKSLTPPKSHFALTLFVFFCCSPLVGVYGILKSCEVKEFIKRDDLERAERASMRARISVRVGIFVGLFGLLYFCAMAGISIVIMYHIMQEQPMGPTRP